MTQRCIAMIGEPYNMSRCGAEIVYRTATPTAFSGWRHVDHDAHPNHGAVPDVYRPVTSRCAS